MNKYSVKANIEIRCERTIKVYARTPEDAEHIAIDLFFDSLTNEEDDICIESMETSPYEEPEYEIGVKVKK